MALWQLDMLCEALDADTFRKALIVAQNLKEEHDLLASRLCAIAFEAGMSGERPRVCWDPNTTDDGIYEVRRVGLAFSLEEVK